MAWLLRTSFVLSVGALLAGCGSDSSTAGGELPLETVAEIPLPGESSRYDYQSADPSRDLLFIAHLGASQVVVVDTKARSVIHQVAGVADAHGVYAVPELGKAFASATGTNELVAIDEDTGQVVRRSPTGEFPDGVTYEPRSGRVFVSNKVGGTVSVIDAVSGNAVGKVDLGGEVGNVQYDAQTGSVLTNAQGLGQLVAIDPNRLKVERRLALPGCIANHGLLVDSERRLAFIACEGNARLLVVDLVEWTVIDDVSVGDGPDVLAFDPSARRLYVASESGVVSVLAERADGVELLAQASLDPSAHTVAVDPETHLVYFPLEDVDGGPVLRIMRPTP